jgi:hypothetical protein
MIEAKSSVLACLRLDQIQKLLVAAGPCITLMLPSYRPGELAKSMATMLKTYLQEAARQLTGGKVPATVAMALLEPLEQLAEDEELLAGSHFGRVIFRSAEVFEQFDLMEPATPALTVGTRFQIRPILAELHYPSEFYVLKLSKKDVGVLQCARLRAEYVRLPKGVPETLDEAMAFKQPDHDLENRSAAGSSVGSMRRVRFGTGSGRETQHTYLADFYKAVDRGMSELLHTGKAPLILAGVDEDTARYRMINTYPNLMEQGVHGSPSGSMSEDDLLRQAYAIIRSHCTERAAADLAESREVMSPARFTTDLEAILSAVANARVSRLYVDQSTQKLGFFQGPSQRERWNWGAEDLLNTAVVETLLNGGSAFALPSDRMPDGAAAAAVLRF